MRLPALPLTVDSRAPPPRHTHTLKPQKGLTLNHVPLESLSSPSWLSPTSLSAGTQVG